MAIRIKNIDYKAPGMRGELQTMTGDIAKGVTTLPAFIIPQAAIINELSLYSYQSFSANTSETLRVTFQVNNNSGVTIGSRYTGSAAGNAGGNDVLSNTKYTIVPGGSNVVTAGTMIEVQFSAVCNTLSKTIVGCIYSPIVHRETR